MRPLAAIALMLPFGGPTAPPAKPAEPWRAIDVAGLTLLVGPADTVIDRHGVTTTAPVEVAGGTGTLVSKLGLARDVTAQVKDADVAQVAALFGDLPAALRSKLVGRIGSVVLTVQGDRLTLTATKFRVPGDPVSRIEATADIRTRAYKAKIFAFGGLAEAAGTLPGE